MRVHRLGPAHARPVTVPTGHSIRNSSLAAACRQYQFAAFCCGRSAVTGAWPAVAAANKGGRRTRIPAMISAAATARRRHGVSSGCRLTRRSGFEAGRPIATAIAKGCNRQPTTFDRRKSNGCSPSFWPAAPLSGVPNSLLAGSGATSHVPDRPTFSAVTASQLPVDPVSPRPIAGGLSTHQT